ncbi:dioxygenase [Bradyrhizobium uaiense]|uniref:Catechol dioxygenase N-terminal domain-containing protein n=1 Tax=Bradyrhizobium uaiense TaxID=2594946 RepID=A0A6P1BQP3_9BRAD|nr:dioxygenase [Bradyrhizobium uaiense]NEV00649.1 hypothetical protein [Bradyrhizobium uaiense]
MTDFTEAGIIDAIIGAFGGTPSPRLKEIVASFARHLRRFVCDVNLKSEEWTCAVGVLTANRISDDTYREFMSLSAGRGLSMLVATLNHHVSGADHKGGTAPDGRVEARECRRVSYDLELSRLTNERAREDAAAEEEEARLSTFERMIGYL